MVQNLCLEELVLDGCIGIQIVELNRMFNYLKNSLKRLSLVGLKQIFINELEWNVMQNMEVVTITNCSKKIDCFNLLKREIPKLLRVNEFSNELLKRRINIFCARCGRPLYTNLSKYMVGEPTQFQIEFELFTDVPPTHSTTTSMFGRPGIMLNCEKNCHKQQWLIDKKSGIINTRGFEYAIACGNDLALVKFI